MKRKDEKIKILEKDYVKIEKAVKASSIPFRFVFCPINKTVNSFSSFLSIKESLPL